MITLLDQMDVCIISCETGDGIENLTKFLSEKMKDMYDTEIFSLIHKSIKIFS